MIKSFFQTLFSKDKHPLDEEETESCAIDQKEKDIDKVLQNNLTILENLYNIDKNIDVDVRHFTIGGIKKKAALFFISSSIDQEVIERHILAPLLNNTNKHTDIKNMLSTRLILSWSNINDLTVEINNGNTVLLIDGYSEAYSFNTTLFRGRSVEKPENEVVLRGPNEAFNENVETNMSLIRKRIKNEDLTFEAIPVSKRSNNIAFLTYLDDLTNEELISRIKKQLNELDVDAISNISVLEQYIEERPKSLFPSILYTERPDRAAKYLENGHIVLIMENSPAALILPATFWTFYHTAEDDYNRFLTTNFTRILRFLAMLITLSVSSLYVAVTTFHPDMIPHELLFAMISTREEVPFPPVIEVLIMQFAFELIREAGLRVPMPVGSTVGIVGALIIGQAAVEASIVSPIVVIIVALDGLSSFSIGDISLGFAVRIIRFIAIVAAAILGVLGIISLFVIVLFYLSSLTSFGVPYFAPKSPHYRSSQDLFFRGIKRNEIFRSGYVKPKDIRKKSRDKNGSDKNANRNS